MIILRYSGRLGNPKNTTDAGECNDISTGLIEQQPVLKSPKLVTFYQYLYNRFIRCMPGYYLALLFALPPVLYGYGRIINPSNKYILTSALIVNIIPVMTWVGAWPYPINGPEWTGISNFFNFNFMLLIYFIL